MILAGVRRQWLAAGVVGLVLASTAHAAPAVERQWRAVRVAGGADALAAKAGLPPGLPGWRLLYEAVRRTHGLWGEDMAPAWVAKAGALPAAGAAADRPVALPLDPSLWRLFLAKPRLADDEIAGAILADRRAALLYRGLSGLDEETLAALAAGGQAVDGIRGPEADAFAAFGARFRVRDGAVVVPGGAAVEAAWQKLVGISPREPARFLFALLRSGGGRLAFLYDTLASLDEPHLRFALGLERPAPAREGALAELAAVFGSETPWWRHDGLAFARPAVDAARVLREVRLDPAGRLAPPFSAVLWDGIFAAGSKPDPEKHAVVAGDASAAWLAAQVAAGPPAVRFLRLEQVLFAQRVFAAAPPSDFSLAVALDGLRDARALVLALERLGTRDAGLYAAGVQAARAVPGRGAGREAALGAFEAALALVEHARLAEALDLEEGERLSRSLFAAAPGGPRAIAGWIDGELRPALARAVADPPGSAADAEAVVLRGVLGDGARRSGEAPVVEWEGLRYKVDVARAEVRRAERVRERQAGPGLDAALAACRGAAPEREDPCPGALGTALVSLVYALHLGDADGPALAGGDPSRHHELSSEPWALPEEVFAPGVSWRVRGSLVGLERALSGVAVRSRASDALPDHPPVLTAAHVRALAPLAVLAGPRDLGERGLQAVVDAVAAGRRRAADLAPGSSDVEAAGRDAGLEPWRVRALDWMLREEPPARESFFSLGELLLLGAPGASLDEAAAWGSSDPLTAGLRLRLPGPRPLDELAGRPPEAAMAERFVDLPLRVALHLRERGLPASLGPAVVGRLLPDLFAEAQPLAPDDRFGLDAWVRGLGAERLDDAVASLVGSGPLQPARGTR